MPRPPARRMQAFLALCSPVQLVQQTLVSLSACLEPTSVMSVRLDPDEGIRIVKYLYHLLLHRRILALALSKEASDGS
eukprot:4254439-Pleurochrysis_carterae.AAC.1